MSNHHRNLRELFSSKYSKPFSNFPSDRLRIGKSPIAVGNFIQYAQKKNAEDKQQRNHTPVHTPNKIRIAQVNINEYALPYKNPQHSFFSKDSNRSRSKSPMQLSIQKSPKQSTIDSKKIFENEDSLNLNRQTSQKLSNHNKFASANLKINLNEVPHIKIPQVSSTTKIKANIQNFESIFNSLLVKYDSIQQQQSQARPAIKKVYKDEQEDEELQIDTQICVTKSSFAFHFVIGKGGFGRVWKVELKKSRTQFAMKEMSKAKIIAKRSVNSVMNERNLLAQFKHPFLINMNYCFQDRDNLYLVMDLLTGGDLRYHIGRLRRFKEHQTKFFVACVILALEYLHNSNVIHRDVKPENIVLDNNGYARLTDLGIARIWKSENSQDTSGTPGYMAPEVMCRQNHTIAVDYFALGIMTYEFMLGRRPYNGRTRQEIRDQILTRQIQVKRSELPDDWSIDAADFINKLIQRKPINRLGFNGPNEVKSHPWIQNFPWTKLLNKEIQSPFIPPPIQENLDYINNISDDNDTQDEQIVENRLLLKKNSVQNLFYGYSYDQNIQTQFKNTKSTSSTLVVN
ncbi:unnamed protein product [Paramecium sonneborni]|uniref:non-specific serine/threonine protein kinase n=1 Tax=Paramecium sonneborni TaxID=65129 RepID=A0A8S1NWC6_9CILI|nr:unnamed protein product [Paramecium sonneborni]